MAFFKFAVINIIDACIIIKVNLHSYHVMESRESFIKALYN